MLSLGLRTLFCLVLSVSYENSRSVPVVPSWITGKCVYGFIITDDHRENFRRLHPNVVHGQSSNPVALVSAASLIVSKARRQASTTEVYHEGKWHICLIHVDSHLFYPAKVDLRRTNEFMAALRKALGIDEDEVPQWYPCYIH